MKIPRILSIIVALFFVALPARAETATVRLGNPEIQRLMGDTLSSVQITASSGPGGAITFRLPGGQTINSPLRLSLVTSRARPLSRARRHHDDAAQPWDADAHVRERPPARRPGASA